MTDLRITKTEVTERFAYFTVETADDVKDVTFDALKKSWHCTCVHGSNWRFREKEPGVCRHIKHCCEVMEGVDVFKKN